MASMDLSSLKSVDREITRTIRKLAWLQDRRDSMVDVKGNGPRCPKGPVPRGRIALRQRRLSPTENTIVAACQTYPYDVWTTADLIAATELNKNTLACALSNLVRSGYIHRVGRAEYKLNPELG